MKSFTYALSAAQSVLFLILISGSPGCLGSVSGEIGSGGSDIETIDTPQLVVSLVTFGDQEVGVTSAPQQVTVTNTHRRKSMRLLAAVTEPPFFADSSGLPVVLGPGQSTVITITFKPTSAGVFNGTLICHLARSPDQTFPLSGTAVGGGVTGGDTGGDTGGVTDGAIAGEVSIVAGTNNTWTDGARTWAGNRSCNQPIGTGVGCTGQSGEITALLCPDSPAIDAGALIGGFHCATSGGHAGEDCREWYGAAPDIGACEFVL